LAAASISWTKEAPSKTSKGSSSKLLDFEGFKDPRYLVLGIGSFVASLGLYVPYYYIGSSSPAPNRAGTLWFFSANYQ
jgi:hypothetical protein